MRGRVGDRQRLRFALQRLEKAPANYIKIAYIAAMKNITLSAEETLIDKARLTARANNTTLNAVFRAWLEEYTSGHDRVEKYKGLMRDLLHIESQGPYSRDEMNER
jgi:hypothetical protein